jgi:small subunit ribosomal protein S3Ae
MFDEKPIGETPALDSGSVVGRVVEVSLSDLTGDRNKYYVKLMFKVKSVSGGRASTTFSGMECTRDYLYRMVRKRAEKIEMTEEFETADKWKLQLTTVTILNRNAESAVCKKVRHQIHGMLDEAVGKSQLDGLLSRIMSTSIQKEIKKAVSKTYPVRYTEVSKIEVVRQPEAG